MQGSRLGLSRAPSVPFCWLEMRTALRSTRALGSRVSECPCTVDHAVQCSAVQCSAVLQLCLPYQQGGQLKESDDSLGRVS